MRILASAMVVRRQGARRHPFTLDSEEAVRALENYRESFRYASDGSCDNWWGEQAVEFRSGKTAMITLFTDNMSTVTEWSKSRVNGKIGFSFMPGKVSVDGGWALAVNAAADRKDAAFEFIKWATDREISVLNTILGASSRAVRRWRANRWQTFIRGCTGRWKRANSDVQERLPLKQTGPVFRNRGSRISLGRRYTIPSQASQTHVRRLRPRPKN